MKGLKVQIDIEGNIYTTNNSPIITYIFLVNNKAVDSSKSLPYELKMDKESTNLVSVIAIDEDANMKKSKNTLTITTPDFEIIPLEYPILTENGIVNAKYMYSDDENDFTYELDLSVDCTADDALDKAAYDGDETTYYNSNSKKNKFYSNTNLNVYNICFKIDFDATGIVVRNANNNNYSRVEDGIFTSSGYWHDVWFKNNNIDFVEEIFKLDSVRVYEIIYDKNL